MGLLDRIGLFFGAELRNALYLVEAQEGSVALGGYVGTVNALQRLYNPGVRNIGLR